MKIRHRLAFVFTLTVAGVLLLLSVVIYAVSREFHRRDFYVRLENRVELTEKFFLELPTMPPEVAQQLRSDFLHKLPEEREWLLESLEQLPDELEPLRTELEAIRPGATSTFSHGSRQGAAKYFADAGRPHLIVVTAFDRFGMAKLTNLRQILLLSFPLALLLAGFVGWMATKRALTPLEKHIFQARRISASNLSARLVLPEQQDEIHDFAQIFNELLERLERAFTFQRTFISNASHEIRNPLTVIAGEAEIALSADRDVASYRRSLEVISEEADRLNQLVNNLLSLARTGGEGALPEKQPVMMGDLLAGMKQHAAGTWPDQQVYWPVLSPQLARMTVSGSPLLLRSALCNLVDNACKYGSAFPVHVEFTAGKNEILWTIRDSGIGIPSQELSLIFVPLFRASNARAYSGQGIGLPLVERIIHLHEGSIEVQSDPATGTVVRVRLKV